MARDEFLVASVDRVDRISGIVAGIVRGHWAIAT